MGRLRWLLLFSLQPLQSCAPWVLLETCVVSVHWEVEALFPRRVGADTPEEMGRCRKEIVGSVNVSSVTMQLS